MFTLNNNELRVNVYFNGDYYIVVTLSDIGIFFMDFKKGYNIFNKNINNIYLGFHTKKALIKSEKIDTKLTEVIELQDDKKYYSDWVKKVIKECGYKNKTALFENMDVCAITAIDDKISIIPQDHVRMDHWVGKKIPNNATIILDSNCSDELLGVSIKEGFKRCVNLKV